MIDVRTIVKTYPHEDTPLLLAGVLHMSTDEIFLHPETKVSEADFTTFRSWYEKRTQGYPAAYLLGYKYFFGRKFTVTPEVLIPRPETEALVERVCSEVRKLTPPVTILEVGTGSGCIAITLAVELGSRIDITATDISRTALAVAKKNAEEYSAAVSFLESNLFEKLEGRKFDIIVANLPYVPQSVYFELYAGLQFEPELALTDGTDTSLLITKFLAQAGNHVTSTGKIFLEIDPTSQPYIEQNDQFSSMQFEKDFNNLTRYCYIQK